MRRVNDTYFERFILSVAVTASFWKVEGTLCEYNVSFSLADAEKIFLVDTSKFEQFSNLKENLEVEVC